MPNFRLNGQSRVWILNFVLTGAALALTVGVLAHLRDLEVQPRVPWWVLSIAFGLAEVWVVHFHFRRDAHSISLSELPLVLGLFFCSPVMLVLAQLTGAALTLAVHRRQPPIKLAFNLANLGLQASTAVVVFRVVLGGESMLGNRAWLAVLLSVAAISALGVVLIVAAISLSEGAPQTAKLGQAMAVGVVGGLTNSSLALIAVIILVNEPGSIWLLLVPTGTLFIAYRAYVSEREKGERIEFLYESSDILQGSKELEEGMLLLLGRIRIMFRSAMAEITLFPSRDEPHCLRTTVGPDDLSEAMVAVDSDVLHELIASRGALSGGLLLQAGAADPELRPHLVARGIVDAMAAPLQGESRVFGTILVANRLGDVTTFDEEDLRLFETLARQASVSLENGQLEHSLAQLKKLEAELTYMAFHDPLTKLANRTLFADRIGHALNRRADKTPCVGLIFIDIDDFKTVNDTLGHSAGDDLLRSVAGRIRSCVRPEDTAARIGGDEFGVLLEGVQDVNDAVLVVDRIMSTMATPFDLGLEEVFVHVSAGIVVSARAEADVEELIRRADLAMYAAKSQGKNRYQVFEMSMREAASGRHDLKSQLERALDRDELEVHYQPIVRLAGGDIAGFEALVRWARPRRDPRHAGSFVPLAEEMGLITRIDALVLERACHQARSWQLNHPRYSDLLMSVNVSARTLFEPGWVDGVIATLHRTGLEPEHLLLEITEGAMMSDVDASLKVFRRLTEVGVKLAIDDFGTGYSSLSWLRTFPVNIAKIPKPFIDALSNGPRELAFVAAIAKLGSTLNIEMIAEGVEHEAQVRHLRELRVSMAQGYQFGHPLDVMGVTELLSATSPAALTRSGSRPSRVASAPG